MYCLDDGFGLTNSACTSEIVALGLTPIRSGLEYVGLAGIGCTDKGVVRISRSTAESLLSGRAWCDDGAIVEAPNESDIPLRVFAKEDLDEGKASKSRDLIPEATLDEAALRAALVAYYHAMIASLERSPKPTRHVWLFVYPTEERARAGRGEWIARASAIVLDGARFPREPEITIRTPPTGAEAPTAREELIYDDLIGALQRRDSAGAYQERVMRSRGTLELADVERMSSLTAQDEARANREIARRYKISRGELERIFIKVAAARM